MANFPLGAIKVSRLGRITVIKRRRNRSMRKDEQPRDCGTC